MSINSAATWVNIVDTFGQNDVRGRTNPVIGMLTHRGTITDFVPGTGSGVCLVGSGNLQNKGYEYTDRLYIDMASASGAGWPKNPGDILYGNGRQGSYLYIESQMSLSVGNTITADVI